MSGKIEHQLASKRSLKLDSVGASAMCGGSLFHGLARTNSKSHIPSGKINTWLTDRESMASEDTCS